MHPSDISNFILWLIIMNVRVQFVTDEECIISPVVEVLAPARTETSAYLLKLPHCLDEGHDRNKVKVRMINENIAPGVVEVPSRDKHVGSGPFYDINPHFIELHTSHFCTIMATYTKKICLERSVNFFFGKFEASMENGVRMNEVQIRPYFCSILYAKIQDFREVGVFAQILCSNTRFGGCLC